MHILTMFDIDFSLFGKLIYDAVALSSAVSPQNFSSKLFIMLEISVHSSWAFPKVFKAQKIRK